MTHASTRDFWTLTSKAGSISYGVTSPFFWVLVHNRFCWCPSRVFPQSCGSSVIKSHWPSKSSSPGVLIPFARTQVGKSVVPLELLQQCENFFGTVVLQFVGCLLSSSIVELMAISSKRIYATYHAPQFCCSCSHGRSLLTCASPGGTHTLKGRSGYGSCESHCSISWVLVHTRFCLHPPSISGGSEI